jgi:hypothetical protein
METPSGKDQLLELYYQRILCLEGKIDQLKVIINKSQKNGQRKNR